MDNINSEDIDDDDEIIAPKKTPGPPKRGVDTAIHTTTLDALLSKFPDRAYVHETIRSVQKLGYLKPLERQALLQYVMAVLQQSIVIDEQNTSDLKVLADAAREAKITECKADATIVIDQRGYIVSGNNSPIGTAWITDGANERKVSVHSAMPAGWVLGRRSTEQLKRVQAGMTVAAAIANRGNQNERGSHWYTNGEINVKVKPGQNPPTGFTLGRTFTATEKEQLVQNLQNHPAEQTLAPSEPSEPATPSPSTPVTDERASEAAVAANIKKAGRQKGSRWFTNGTENVLMKPDEQPPAGFRPGRTMSDEAKLLATEILKKHRISGRARNAQSDELDDDDIKARQASLGDTKQ